MNDRGRFVTSKEPMTTKLKVYQIRADFNEREIAVYAKFEPVIANTAITHQKLLPPFAYDRMTWIKPSFLW